MFQTLGIVAFAALLHTMGDPPVVVVEDAHDGWTRSLAFSPDGEVLVTGGSDAKIRLWDPRDAALRHTIDARHGP